VRVLRRLSLVCLCALVVPSAASATYPLVVVPNWRTELRQRLQAGGQ